MGGIARNFLGLTPASDPQIKKFSRNDLHIICLYGYPPSHPLEGLTVSEVNGKYEQGNKLLSSIFAYVCMFFPPWYWFFGLVLSQFYDISSLLFPLILSWPSILFPFTLSLFYVLPFSQLNYIPVPTLIKKKETFLIYKEIQNGAVAKSYMTLQLLHDFATAPFWISLYMRKIFFSFYQCTIPLTRLFSLFNVQIAHPLDIYRTCSFLNLYYYLSTILNLLLSSNSFFILFLLST